MKEFNEKEQDIIQACASNHWLSNWEEYPDYDYDYSFREVTSQEDLMKVFLEGNWSIRSGVIFGDLAFVQQVNGGDEWLTMKHEEGRYKVFESISFQAVLENRGEQGFVEYINKLQVETVDQYWGRDSYDNPNKQHMENKKGQEKHHEYVELAQEIYDCEYYRKFDLREENYTAQVFPTMENLQKFFENTGGQLGTIAVYENLLFLKESQVDDNWLVFREENGNFTTMDFLTKLNVSQASKEFSSLITDLQSPPQYKMDDYSEKTVTEDATEIYVLKIEVGKEPYVKVIENDLKSLQAEVGGLIQVVLLENDMEGPQMIVNDEGKINGMEMNRRMSNDIICGDFFICQADEEGELVSLSSENIEKYSEMFQEIPEFSDHEPDAEPRITVIGFNY